MYTLPTRDHAYIIALLASAVPSEYAASVFTTGPTGKQRASGLLGYFPSEKGACQFAVSYAKVLIDGTTLPAPHLARPG